MNVIEKANAAKALIPDQYDLKVMQMRTIKEKSGNSAFDMIMTAFYFGYSRALDSKSGE